MINWLAMDYEKNKILIDQKVGLKIKNINMKTTKNFKFLKSWINIF
jgi:hypothetical protein